MKTALITGASGAIGAAAARALAKQGYALALGCAAHPERARALGESLGEVPWGVYPADMADPEAVAAMVRAAEKDFSPPTVLVNCAGLAYTGLLQDMADEDWNRVLAVNLSGCFYACRAVLPGMVARGGGSIVNVSSLWGVSGASCEAAYSAAKAGVIGLTKALAQEVGPAGVRVNCVAPGVIDTPMNAAHSPETLAALAARTPLGRLGTPEEAAAAIAFLAGDGAAFITGQVLLCDGGFLL